MTFQAPDLQTYNDDDLNYLTKWNNNVASISSAFDTIEADLNAISQATGASLAADWYRRLTTSSQFGGVVGSDCFVFEDTGSNTFALRVSSDGSSVAVIGSTRRVHLGDLSGNLSDLALADATYTIYVGLDSLGDSDVTVGFSTSQSAIEMVLYELDVTVSSSGTVYTTNSVKRFSESLLWDNTVEQLRQTVPMVWTFHYSTLTSGDNPRFQIPVDARISKMRIHQVDDLGATTINIKDSTDTDTYLTLTLVAGLAADVMETADPVAAFDELAFAAGTEFLIDVASLAVPGEATMYVEMVPTYGLATVA